MVKERIYSVTLMHVENDLEQTEYEFRTSEHREAKSLALNKVNELAKEFDGCNYALTCSYTVIYENGKEDIFFLNSDGENDLDPFDWLD